LLYGLLGVSIAVLGPSIFTVLTRWFTEKRGLAFGVTSAGTGFGTLVVAPLTNALIASYGWRNAFFILAQVHGLENIYVHSQVVALRIPRV
jgi:MFS family permease